MGSSILTGGVLAALRKLQAIKGDMAVAGGYLRDLRCQVPPKDIDVFCSGLTEAQVTELYIAFPDAKLATFSTFLQYSASEVAHVYDLGTVNGLPLQLIELSTGYTPLDRYQAHDFGICQMLDDGVNSYLTKAATLDWENGTFTLVHCESGNEYDRSIKRWERLSKKYPDWKLVDNFKGNLWPI
jgi:hypothetical protein